MVRVSGVPYEVNLDSVEHYKSAIEVLELENRLMRARMDRLEEELRVANELVHSLNLKLLNQGHYTRGKH